MLLAHDQQVKIWCMYASAKQRLQCHVRMLVVIFAKSMQAYYSSVLLFRVRQHPLYRCKDQSIYCLPRCIWCHAKWGMNILLTGKD
eukprot:scaffold301536_cov24-Prasinocladus_malaysianus.AAC.1